MRWKCTCAYDGTDFNGWQSQPLGNTVQDILEARLAYIFKKPVRIHASGRTDAGVHARGQVFHFDAEWNHAPVDMLRGMRSNVPRTIQVIDIRQVSELFHARFSAVKKRYIYQIHLGQASPFDLRYFWSVGSRVPDVQKMQDAATVLLGKHDFSAFAAKIATEDQGDTVKTLYRLDVVQRGKKVLIITEGSGYLYKMVRSLAAALFHVGIGKLTKADIAYFLESRVRTQAIESAPAEGLILDKVFYNPNHTRLKNV